MLINRHLSNFFKVVVIALLFFSTAFSSSIFDIEPKSAINDRAGILSHLTADKLENLTRNIYKKTGVSVVFVSVKSIENYDIDDFSSRLYEKWKIGNKKTDEGVLLVIALRERKIRIEVGYGSEGYITDLQSSRIIKTVSSEYLSKGLWDDGITASIFMLASLIAEEKGVQLTSILETTGISYERYSSVRNANSSGTISVLGIFKFLFIGFIFIVMMVTPGGRTLLFYLILSSMSGGRYRSSGFGGFGGGSSGFGGFGGGSSGGGGASGGF